MFMIKNVVCDDRRVGEVLLALAGKLVAQPVAVPMINAKVQNGKLTALNSGGGMVHLLRPWLTKHRVTDVTPDTIRKFLAEHGRSGGSYSYLLRHAVEGGILRKVGTNGHYTLVAERLALPAPKKKAA